MKINNIIGVASIMAAMLTACESDPKFQVEGTISEADGKMLYLEAMTLDGIQRIDSTRLKGDGAFCFNAPAPTNPEFYALCVDNQRINFSIDSTETVRFNCLHSAAATRSKGLTTARKSRRYRCYNRLCNSKSSNWRRISRCIQATLSTVLMSL